MTRLAPVEIPVYAKRPDGTWGRFGTATIELEVGAIMCDDDGTFFVRLAADEDE